MDRVVGGCLGVRVLVFYTSFGTVKRLIKAPPKSFSLAHNITEKNT